MAARREKSSKRCIFLTQRRGEKVMVALLGDLLSVR